jgi:predicted metal-dependent peptidase
MNESAEDKMLKARTLLVLDHCFWGVLALKLKMAPADANFCPTACTNGKMLMYNPEYIESLSNQEVIGLLAHEVGHCAMGHIWRMGDRDPRLSNIAMDYVLNSALLDANFTLPPTECVSNEFKNKSFEEAYEILRQRQPKEDGDKDKKGKKDSQGKAKGKNQGGQNGPQHPDPGKCGGVYPPSSGKQEEMKADWKAAVAQAVQTAQGTMPADLKKLLDIEVLNPTLPWYVLLREFVERTARNDYNWSNPSRRYLSRGIILPGLISEELPSVVVVVDSSGSTCEWQEKFAAEASGVLSAYKTHITLIHCDARVQSVEEFDSDDLPLKIQASGYGGTDFRPPFEYIKKHGLTPACLIYLTDLCGTFPKEEPDYPVMWVSVVPDQRAPWGETVPMKVR